MVTPTGARFFEERAVALVLAIATRFFEERRLWGCIDGSDSAAEAAVAIAARVAAAAAAVISAVDAGVLEKSRDCKLRRR